MKTLFGFIISFALCGASAQEVVSYDYLTTNIEAFFTIHKYSQDDQNPQAFKAYVEDLVTGRITHVRNKKLGGVEYDILSVQSRGFAHELDPSIVNYIIFPNPRAKIVFLKKLLPKVQERYPQLHMTLGGLSKIIFGVPGKHGAIEPGTQILTFNPQILNDYLKGFEHKSKTASIDLLKCEITTGPNEGKSFEAFDKIPIPKGMNQLVDVETSQVKGLDKYSTLESFKEGVEPYMDFLKSKKQEAYHAPLRWRGSYSGADLVPRDFLNDHAVIEYFRKQGVPYYDMDKAITENFHHTALNIQYSVLTIKGEQYYLLSSNAKNQLVNQASNKSILADRPVGNLVRGGYIPETILTTAKEIIQTSFSDFSGGSIISKNIWVNYLRWEPFEKESKSILISPQQPCLSLFYY